MATATNIRLPEGNTPEASRTVTRLLQENHKIHHMFFNGEGFHNHINHGLLTLWALGASSSDLQDYYDLNKVFQQPQQPLDAELSSDLLDDETFLKHMGDDKHYKAFLDFFAREIDKTSWQDVAQTYPFAGDKRTDAMLVRLFDSFLHPLIHLGFGPEFKQPAIVAEALAQTACRQNWIGELLLPAEEASKAGSASESAAELPNLVRADKAILQAPHWDDQDKIQDGILNRSGNEMIHYLSQVKLTAGAQRNGKEVKLDFYLLHCLTAANFFPTFLEQSWLSDSNEARLLEWKIRMDLVMYASRKSPALRMDSIRNYRTKGTSDWYEIKNRVCSIPDDGHAAKVVRAIAQGHQFCKPFQAGDAYRLKDGDWHQLALMAIDSREILKEVDHAEIQFDGPGKAWVRSAGFDEAWIRTNVPETKVISNRFVEAVTG